MKRSRFTEVQVAYALRQAEAGMPVMDVCRSLGISEATFYIWKKKYGPVLTLFGVLVGCQMPERAVWTALIVIDAPRFNLGLASQASLFLGQNCLVKGPTSFAGTV